jgi:hypothetical protein
MRLVAQECRSKLMTHDSTSGTLMSILSMSYSNTIGLKPVNLKDFVAAVVDRLVGDFAGFHAISELMELSELGPCSN